MSDEISYDKKGVQWIWPMVKNWQIFLKFLLLSVYHCVRIWTKKLLIDTDVVNLHI